MTIDELIQSGRHDIAINRVRDMLTTADTLEHNGNHTLATGFYTAYLWYRDELPEWARAQV